MAVDTPAAITPALRGLADRVVPGGTPAFIPYAPRADGEIQECFATVARQVAAAGGAVQHGWALWEWPMTFVEAEFHAVWRSPMEELIDVTPNTRRHTQILFVPDPARRFEGRAIDNVRVPLRADPRIARFIAIHERRFAILNAGDLATQFGAVEVTGDAARELRQLMGEAAHLELQLREAVPSAGRNDPCPCGSGKKFKKCHGTAA